ncbi:hypothetical protein SLI_1504 [Streptomyces lividans 1326]|uniref:Uncharacterized protein n=1 Tax=Streptomyces lividans 1326 TaxID=1200984 RepID=A0A7U9DR90_STRLI|nr:hypothetical protein SLI_1504 [Streptomyces lividans 1326]
MTACAQFLDEEPGHGFVHVGGDGDTHVRSVLTGRSPHRPNHMTEVTTIPSMIGGTGTT